MQLVTKHWLTLLVLAQLQGTKCITRQELTEMFHSNIQEMSTSRQNIIHLMTNATLSFPKYSSTKKHGRVYYPIRYGADPNGEEESSDAILNALEDAFSYLKNKRFQLMPGVYDLGGIIIDLQGGNYKISKPIRFPPGIGNLVIQSGTLRASNNFPSRRHLIELRSPNSWRRHDNIYHEDITFRDILFDSSYRGGGVHVVDSVRVRISNCFFIHFKTQGILVQRGHETFISSCFLGQHSTVGEHKNEKQFSGTAIDIASNDNSINEVVIFSAAIGVVLRGEANIVTGVHCYNKASVFGGIGILVKLSAPLTRINNCYLDYTNILIEDPVQVHVSNGLFIGSANIVLRSIKDKISGLNIINNMFEGNIYHTNPIVELDGNFTNIDQVVIDNNNANRMSLKSTVGRLTVAGKGTKWVADFSSLLIFPNRINHFQYSFYITNQTLPLEGYEHYNVVHAVTNVANNIVVVESNKVVNGVVSVSVDQYKMVGETHYLA